MRLLIWIIGTAVIGSVVGRLILKRTSGLKGVEKVMPKVIDKAFGKLAPARRQEMLAHFHATLAGLEEKYGSRTEHAEEPTE